MSPFGQPGVSTGLLVAERSLPLLESLPRPLYARAESLPPGTYSALHRHAWGQLSYTIEGVLDIRTPIGNYVALPQCAVWIPAGLEHQVINLGHVEMRSFYLDPVNFNWPGDRCRVLHVTLLVRELIRVASALPPEYPLDGPESRLVQVLVDQLRALPEAAFSLAVPTDTRLQRIYRALLEFPGDRRTLCQWAVQSGASERNLARLFLRETGLPFRLWRQRLRLMLSLGGLESGHPVMRVAQDYGYDSPSSYIAAFKALFGQTPGDLERN